jgi:hypothetical protein
MSYTGTRAMAERVPFMQALEWHLQYNCYPPVSLEWMPAAEAAIDKVVESIEGDADAHHMDEVTVTGPDGSEYRAWYLLEALHLEAFVDSRMEESEASDE